MVLSAEDVIDAYGQLTLLLLRFSYSQGEMRLFDGTDALIVNCGILVV